MGAVGTRRGRHVRRWTRQRRARPAAAALVSAAAPARLAVLHQHWHRHSSRRTRALQQKNARFYLTIIYIPVQAGRLRLIGLWRVGR